MNRLWFCTLLIIIFCPDLSASQAMSLKEKTIRFCAGTHEWPPYYYFKRINGKKTKEVKGFDIDLFDEIFTKNGISYSAELLSWKRCLKEAMSGNKYDVVFGGGLNDDRMANYVTTKGYYTVMPSYFYAKKKFPAGVTVQAPSDLKKYGKLCGVSGFNYVNFGQRNEDVDMGAADYKGLFRKTLLLRCDISFARYEILVGWETQLNTGLINNEDLVFSPIPGIPPESFHLMISKHYKHAQELKLFFESELNKLEHSGKLKLLLGKYINSTEELDDSHYFSD